MRAFLSHSSKNKGIVKKVFEDLGSALAEFDEKTFHAGQFNIDAIEKGLTSSDLFVLFATPESLSSGYVAMEARLAQEHLAQRKLKKILTFCLDDVRPEDLPGILPTIAAVRRINSPGAIARTIRSSLVDMSLENGELARPFIGRDDEKQSLTRRLSDPEQSTPSAIILSGVDGVGRRTLAKKVFEDIYPYLTKVLPTINLISGSGAPEIFRELLSVNSSLSKSEIFEQIETFDRLADNKKHDIIAQTIEEISDQNQILFVFDDGGLLLDDGSLNDVMKHVVVHFSSKSPAHPPLCFITFRTTPGKAREKKGVVYHKVDPLSNSDIKMLVSLHSKRKRLSLTSAQVDKIAELIDGHPYNLEYILELLDTTSVDSLLGDPADMIAFKRRQGDEFLNKVQLAKNELLVLSVLRVLGPSPTQILSEVLVAPPDQLAKILKTLEEKHCIERSGDVASINRPLRSAIERAPHLRLNKADIIKIREKAVEVFKEFNDEDDIPVSLISTAARAAALSNVEDKYLSMFVSPANAVLVARQLYDAKSYDECERMCSRALSQDRLITREAALEARRLRCLSLIRLGRDDDFQAEVALIDATSKRGRSLQPFLLGFRQRIRGYPAEACDFFETSLKFNPNAFATLRELAHSWLIQGEPGRAKAYCDRALEIAPTNPYVLDQALAIEISQRESIDSYILYDSSIEGLLERLKRYGNEDGLSFYSIRMADICRRISDFDGALTHLENAKRLTPSHVPAYIMECEILLARGEDPTKVDQKLEAIRTLIDGGKSGEGKTNLPEFLSLKIKMLAEGGKVRDALRLLISSEKRIGGRTQELKRRVAFHVDSTVSLDPEERRFLMS